MCDVIVFFVFVFFYDFSEDLSSIIQLLKEKLSDLPTEEPIGSEDIYGQDIGLMFFTDYFQWSNGTYYLFLYYCLFIYIFE